jgi:thiol-disulfide isomerase/thioredoxin
MNRSGGLAASPRTDPRFGGGRGTTASALVVAVLAAALPGFAQSAEETRESGWAVTGQALNEAGLGVAGADVEVELGGSRDEPGAVVGRGTTDKMGDFRVGLPGEPEGPLFVRIGSDAYAEFYAEAKFDPGDPEAFVVVDLVGSNRLGGTVYDEKSGEPVAGATVRLDTVGHRWATTTGADGRYTLADLPPNEAMLTVRCDGFETVRRPIDLGSGAGELDLMLAPERPIAIVVLNDIDAPVAEATVQARVGPEDPPAYARTDADGRAVVHGIPYYADSIRVRVDHPEHVPMRPLGERVDLGKPRRGTSQPATQPAIEHTIRLRRAGSIEGVIVDAESAAPINGARVIVGEEMLYGMPTDWTAADGRFRVGRLAPGAHLLTIHRVDYSPTTTEAAVHIGETTTVRVPLRAGRPIAGRIVDPEGKPLANAEVRALRWRGYSTLGLAALTDEEGRFEIDHVPDGPVDFWFVSPDRRTREWRILRGGMTDLTITLEAGPPGTGELVAGPPAEAAMAPAVTVGRPAPAIRVTSIDGTKYDLRELRGREIFIDIWATWCPPCVAELPHLKKLHADTADRTDFLMIGISLDADAGMVRTFANENGIGWVLVAGADSGAQAAANAFGAELIPFNCLIGPDGTVVAVEIHGPDMAARVEALLKGGQDGPP